MLLPNRSACLALVSLVLVLLAGGAARAGDFVNFESAHVHPISLSDPGKRLFAVNTPEARLAIFGVTPRGELFFKGDVPVGLEPVSLAVRPGTDEVWVANHLSDSVSVVDGAAMTLIATLQVGDEVTDLVEGEKVGIITGHDAELTILSGTDLPLGDGPELLRPDHDGDPTRG